MQRQLEFEGAPLKMEPRREYVQRKQDERHARPNSPHNQMEAGEQAGALLHFYSSRWLRFPSCMRRQFVLSAEDVSLLCIPLHYCARTVTSPSV